MGGTTGTTLSEATDTLTDPTGAGTGPDGSELALAGTTADVARFDEEHGWRYVIDNPFGTA